jgi:hypothetical protein
LSNIGKKETRRERQEAWKVILKILRRRNQKRMFLSIIEKKETYEERDKKLRRSF